MRVTMKVKVKEIPEIKNISGSYQQAIQFGIDTCWKNNFKHKFALHHFIYKEIRNKFNLKSQFAVNAIAKAFECSKSSKSLKGSKPTIKSSPIVFDKRLASFKWDKIRVATNDKRIDIPLKISDYYSKYSDWSFQTAMLIQDKQKRWFFHITVSKDITADSDTQKVVGIDVGVNNIAVTSEGDIFTGHKTRIKQYQWLRSRLQRKGTKSSRRKLKSLSGGWKRYMRDFNHRISKQIVSTGDIFVLEDLANIRRNRRKYIGKRLNRWINSWSFRQLQEMIAYKAEMQGKKAVFVNPYMTSQTCSNCGNTGSRYNSSFFCPSCHFVCDSDINASFNLRRLYVNQPNVTQPIGVTSQPIHWLGS